jgi:hypothetical protein
MNRSRLLVLLGAGLVSLPAAAHPDDEPVANCEVRIIHALHEGEGIDARITKLRPYLEKAPFTAWKQFKLLEDKDLPLAPHATDKFRLPNGKEGSLTYVDHLLREDRKHRLRLRLAIHDGAKEVMNTVFVLDEGGVVVQAGQHYQRGLLILGVSCAIDH